MGIAEGMHYAARSMHAIAGSEITRLLADAVAQLSFQHIDDLFIAAMAVGGRHAGTRADGKFEHAGRGPADDAIDEIADFEAADADGCLGLRLHGHLPQFRNGSSLSIASLNRLVLEAKQRRRNPSPPVPNAAPGAMPTRASSTSLMASLWESGSPSTWNIR